MFRALCIGLLAWSTSILALDYTVEIVQVSSSGKTVLVDRGFNDQIDTDDFGILLAKEKVVAKGASKKNMAPRFVYKPVAKLKAVRVLSNTSVWIVYRSFMPARLKKGERLALFSETALLQGRKELDIGRKVIVDRPEQVAQTLKNSLVAEGGELVEKGAEYDEAERLHPKEEHLKDDITLVDLEVWEKDGLPGQRRYEGFYKSPYAADFANRMRVQRFEKMVAVFLRKFNDPKFTYKEIYEKGIPGSPGVLGGSTYERASKVGSIELRRQQKMYDDLRSKGENWSDGYSDEELSELLYNLGAVSEVERRKFVGQFAFDYQFHLSVGLNLLNNENLNDRQNTEPSKYEFSGGLEWFLLKKFRRLEAFSVEASLRRSRDAFTTGDYNATGTEYSAAFGINWYPFRPAKSIETNIVFLGAFFRYGWARYEIGSLGEEGNYHVISFPGLQAGLKYNFANGYGARLAADFESVVGDRIVRTDDEGELPDRVSHLEGKISIGLSRFF